MKSLLPSLTTVIAFGMIATSPPILAQTPFACEEESGAAYGLCNAYCEAMDCDNEQSSTAETACLKVQDRFIQKTGRDLPCITPPPECPCFTHQEVAEIADVALCETLGGQ